MKGSAAISATSTSSRKLAKIIANSAFDMKAEGIIVLDMRKQVNFCDYFVITSGNSDRQVSAIAEHIQEDLQEIGVRIKINNSMQKSNWVVFDAGDVVTHVFHKDARSFYNLEGLWQDAKDVVWEK